MYARQHALDHPDKAAIIMGTSGETVTYGEYEARCDRAAHLLRAAGLQRGDHIAVFMENSARMLEIEGAAERTGLYFTLINTYLAPDEVAYIVANSRSQDAVQLGRPAPGRAGRGSEVPGARAPADDRTGRTARGLGVLRGRRRRPSGLRRSPDESLGAAMLYSSGTTGQPKGVLRDLPTNAPSDSLPVMQFVQRMFGFRARHDLPQPGAALPLGPAGERVRRAAARRDDRGDGALRRRAVAGRSSSGTGSPTARWCR